MVGDLAPSLGDGQKNSWTKFSYIAFFACLYTVNLIFFIQFVLCKALNNTTSRNIGGRMHGLSPLQILGDRPPSPPKSPPMEVTHGCLPGHNIMRQLTVSGVCLLYKPHYWELGEIILPTPSQPHLGGTTHWWAYIFFR